MEVRALGNLDLPTLLLLVLMLIGRVAFNTVTLGTGGVTGINLRVV